MASPFTPTQPLDLLGAVNQLLVSARCAKVTSLLDADLNEDSAAALDAINRAALLVQSRAGGWSFQVSKPTLSPDPVTGYVHLPITTASVKPIEHSREQHLVARGGRLYDTDMATFVIGKDVKVELVELLEFQSLPLAARQYVAAVAASEWVVARRPDPITYRQVQAHLESTTALMEQYDQEVQGDSLPEGSPHFANMRKR